MSIGDAATKAGCTGYTQSSAAAPFATEWGTCTFNGTQVQVYAFPNEEAFTGFLDTVKSFGITREQMIEAPGGIVFAPKDQTQTAALRAAVAG